MRRLPGHRGLLIIGFCLIIYGVPVSQAIIEWRRGEPIQALDIVREPPTQENLRAFETDLEEQSWFAEASRPWMQLLRFKLLRDPGDKAVLGNDGWWFYRPGVAYLIEDYADDLAGVRRHDQLILAVSSFHRQLAERGIRLLVVPVPVKPSVYPDKLSMRFDGPNPKLRAHTQRVIGELRDRGVEVFDLYGVFAETRTADATSDAPPLYLKRDTHWTPEGMESAASAVAERLLELGWIDRGQTAYRTEPVDVNRMGDVLEMMRNERVEALFEPQRITCRRVLRADSDAPFADDPNAEVIVLGDSFLRIYQKDKPGAAGFVAHLAKELHRPLATIINDGGAATMVREQLAARPEWLARKRVVVWEFVEREIRFGWEEWREVTLPPVTPSTTAADEQH